MPSEICGKGNVFVYNFCMGFFLVFIPGSLCVFLIKALIMGSVKAGGLCRYREKLKQGTKEIKRKLDRRTEKKHNISFFGTQLSWILLRVALLLEKC